MLIITFAFCICSYAVRHSLFVRFDLPSRAAWWWCIFHIRILSFCIEDKPGFDMQEALNRHNKQIYSNSCTVTRHCHVLWSNYEVYSIPKNSILCSIQLRYWVVWYVFATSIYLPCDLYPLNQIKLLLYSNLWRRSQ